MKGDRMETTNGVHKFVLFTLIFSLVVQILLVSVAPDMLLFWGQYIYLFIPVIGYILLKERQIQNVLKIHKVSMANMGLSVAILLAMQPFLMVMSGLSQLVFGNALEGLAEEILRYPLWASAYMIAVMPAICEEMLFRGVVLHGYRNHSMKTAIIMNGVLFGLFHLNGHQFVYTFFIGVALALVTWVTGSILPAMVMHFLNNYFSVSMLYSTAQMAEVVDESATELFSDPLSIIIGLAIAFTSALVSLYLMRVLMKRNGVTLNSTVQNEATEAHPLVNWAFWGIIGVFLLFAVLTSSATS